MKTKKILSVLFSILLVFSFCSFSVFAADGTEPIDVSDMTITGSYYVSEPEVAEIDCTEDLICKTYYNSSVFDGMYSIRFPDNVVEFLNLVILTEPFSINSEHEYNISFDWGFAQTNNNAVCVIYLNYYDVDGNLIKEQLIGQQNGDAANKLHSIDVDFKPDVSGLESGYKCSLMIGIQCTNTLPLKADIYFISQEINLIDKDDDSGWFQKIINKIEETINNIKQIPEKINQKLTELKDGIGEFFTQLGEDIKGFFEMLKNYLLYFQHPVTLNSEGVLVDENGEPIYTNPFDSALSDVEATVNGWIADIKQFIKDMDESRIEVSGYLETGTGFINDIMSAHPIISACVIFAAAFFVIRKVVGR